MTDVGSTAAFALLRSAKTAAGRAAAAAATLEAARKRRRESAEASACPFSSGADGNALDAFGLSNRDISPRMDGWGEDPSKVCLTSTRVPRAFQARREPHAFLLL